MELAPQSPERIYFPTPPRLYGVSKHFPEEYAARFTALNATKMQTGIVAKIRQFLGFALRKLTFSGEFKWATHLSAEHMSRGHLAGNFTATALNHTIKMLEKLRDPPRDVIKGLRFAMHISKQEERLVPRSFICKEIKRKLKTLAVGESVAVPSGCGGHAMMLWITCTGIDDHGRRIYKAVQHNEGLGITEHHACSIQEDGKTLYQTALEIEDVQEEDLCGPKSTFFESINPLSFKSKEVDRLYEELLPKLKGRILPPRGDVPRLWSMGQLGGSCTARCCVSLIRAQVPWEVFQEFEDLARTEMLLKSYRQILNGWGSHSTQKIVTLEVLRDIEARNARFLPPVLLAMKVRLEGMVRYDVPSMDPFWRRHARAVTAAGAPGDHLEATTKLNGLPITLHADPTTIVATDSIADNVNLALSILQHGKYSDVAIKDALPFVTKAVRDAFTRNAELPPEEQKKLKALAALIKKRCHNRRLTFHQLYVLTALSAVIVRSLPPESKKERLTAYRLADAFISLDLDRRISNDAIDAFLLPHLMFMYRKPPGIRIPKKLQNKMEQSRLHHG